MNIAATLTVFALPLQIDFALIKKKNLWKKVFLRAKLTTEYKILIPFLFCTWL